MIFEREHDKTKEMTCAPEKTQIGQSIRTSVIRVFHVPFLGS